MFFKVSSWQQVNNDSEKLLGAEHTTNHFFS